ncbi:Tfp pilus assembly protein PilF [Methanophagales archaeon]|nr:Tfp pilus assembly protein PilF [Methanophagales archaeon]
MDQNELMKSFLDLEDKEEEIVEAWALFIAVQKVFRDAEAGIISKRERDNVQRAFIKHMRKNKLVMQDEEDKLKAHEVAIYKEGGAKNELKPLSIFDLWLIADFKDVCAAYVADDLNSVEGVSDMMIKFLRDPSVDGRMKERLIEKDMGKGEKLLNTVIDNIPTDVNAHLLLVELYDRAERYVDAEAEYKRFLSETDDEVVWANYGHFLEKRERYEDSLDAFKNSLAHCERAGKEEYRGFLDAMKDCITRVERMKNLEGEAALKAREYQEAEWMIEDIREFAENRFEKELAKAEEEYKDERDLEAIMLEDAFDFINWFVFNRKLGDDKTPGMLYAEENGLSSDLMGRIEGLGNPVAGNFEVVGVDHAAFKLLVKDRATETEYTLMGNVPELIEGQTFVGNIYPWADFYLTGGGLKVQDEESSQDINKE